MRRIVHVAAYITNGSVRRARDLEREFSALAKKLTIFHSPPPLLIFFQDEDDFSLCSKTCPSLLDGTKS